MNLTTIIDEGKVDEWCSRLPECRTFIENFFFSCQMYDRRTNFINYIFDIAGEIMINPSWNDYVPDLMDAFQEIVR